MVAGSPDNYRDCWAHGLKPLLNAGAFFIMEKGCYILFSEKLNRYYIGACQNGVASRIEKHNTGFYGNSSYTATASDWKLVLFLEAVDYTHALRMERKIKQM